MRHKDSFVPPVRNTALVSMVAWGLVPEQMDSTAFQRIRRDVKRDLRAFGLRLQYGHDSRYMDQRRYVLHKRVGRKGSNFRQICFGTLQEICRSALTHIEAKHPLPMEVT